nr:hypothetical protein [Tanacetum cinerariifolium]
MKLGADEAVNHEEGDRVERDITNDASLEDAKDNDNITKTLTMTMPNVEIPQGQIQDRLKENIELTDTIPTPHDSPLTGGYTPGSDEGRITLAELMETCTILSNRVTQLETELSTTKAVYNKAFITLINRVKKLKSQLKQNRSKAVIHSLDEEGPSVHIKDSPKQGRIIEEMNKDESINLVSEQREVQETVDHSREEEAEAQGDSDQEVKELKLYKRIIPEEDIAIEAIPLAIKPPVIIEYKIVKEGKISAYHITKADGSTRRYTLMINLLENIDREDLETLWKLLRDKYATQDNDEATKKAMKCLEESS